MTHGPIDVASGFAFRDVFALVGFAFAAGEADEEFGAAVGKVEFQGYERIAGGTGKVGELTDLPPMGQKGTSSDGIVLVCRAGIWVLGNVNAMQGEPNGPLRCPNPPFGQTRLAGPNRLDLAPYEPDPALQGVDNVIVPSPTAIEHDGV